MLDLRLAVRALRATPIVTAVAVLSLALGIGANTAIFSLVNSLILRALPVANPQRLVLVSVSANTTYRPPFSYATFDQIRQHSRSFASALAFSNRGKATLTVGGKSQAVDRFFVSGDFFDTLGVSPLLGRLLTPADDVPSGGRDGRVAVIGYKLWQERFGGAVSVIGASVILARTAVTIVGVTPREFLGVEVGSTFDMILPIKVNLPGSAFDDDVPWLSIMLRLKPAVSLASATATLRAVQPQVRVGALPKRFQAVFLSEPFTLERAGAGTSTLRDRFERPLVAILAVVALVLLIACANIANLLLARGAARRHEWSVRLALGASRWHLVHQLLAESVVLAGLGTLFGLAFAKWAAQLLVTQLSTSTAPIALNLSLDWRVLAFTATTMVAAVVVFGIAPAIRATHVVPVDALREHGRAARADGAMGSALIIAQVALSLLLVVAAGLFVRTFQRLAGAPLGFDPDRVLLATITAPTVPGADRKALYHRLVHAASSVPGVAHAGGSLNPPIAGSLVGDILVTPPGVAPAPDAEAVSQTMDITPDTLASYGTPILAGRDFDERDTETAPNVMLVNEAFVRRFLSARNPIGVPLALTFRSGSSGDIPLGTWTIVGVAADAAYRSIRTPMQPTIYTPLAQRTEPLLFTYFYIALRSSSGAPALLAHGVADALKAVNPEIAMTFRPMTTVVDESLAQDRLVAVLAGFFGVLALLLAGLGLYGVTAYAVTRRRGEIGIRMALGAQTAGIARLVLSHVAFLVSVGVLIGIAGSLWASRFVASLLYGLAPRDPATFVGAVFTLAAVAALAGWIPAYRASRIDLAEVLREA